MNRYEFTVAFTDGQIHAHVLYRGVFVATRTFKPDEPMSAIEEWCKDSALWTRDIHSTNVEDKICYSHDDGKIHLTGFLGTHTAFDPNSDESMAKLVRHLKRRAPILNVGKEQPTLVGLPIPTQEDLDRRIIATRIGIPDGVSSHGLKPRYRSQQSAVSQAKTKEIVDGILAGLLEDL